MNLMLPSIAFSFKATKQQQSDIRRTAIFISVAIQTMGALQKNAGSFFQCSVGSTASSVLFPSISCLLQVSDYRPFSFEAISVNKTDFTEVALHTPLSELDYSQFKSRQ